MQKQNSNPWRRSRALYVLPVAALSLSAFATPKFIKPIEQAVTEMRSKGTQNAADVQVKVQEKLPLAATSPLADVQQTEILVAEMPDAGLMVVATDVKDSATTDATIYDKVEVPAQFARGDAALLQFLANNIVYPQLAQEWGIKGRVILQFVIEPDGSVSNVKIIRGVSKPDGLSKDDERKTAADKNETEKERILTEEIFDQAAKALEDESVRVTKLTSSHWSPGKLNGRNVRSHFVLPIYFRL